MVGSLERVFRQAIRYNVKEIGRNILCPICQSMLNADDEPEALNNLFKELTKLEDNPQILGIPPNLRSLGIFEMRVNVEVGKTHSRTVDFLGSGRGAETSDLAILITHEFSEPTVTTLVDEKISFFQAKIESRKNGFKIPSKQWYLMRYWPTFSYGGRTFDLISCRKVPDICSFYLFLFRHTTFSDIIFGTKIPLRRNTKRSICDINSICMSTPWMGRLNPSFGSLTEEEILRNKPIALPSINQTDGDEFFRLLFLLFLTHLGVHDPQGICLMKTMFQKLLDKNDPPLDEEGEEKPSIGVKINIQLKTEFNPLDQPAHLGRS